MQIEERSLEHDDIATPIWAAPIAMLVAWVPQLFEHITRMKRVRRTTKFKPHWRDHFAGLVQLEWLRDQMLAAGAAHLLAGKSLDEDCGFIPSTEPPADYGGPCPRTPFEMNRRFLAVARFNADPEAAIRRHAARIAARAAHGSTDAAPCAAAHHELAVFALAQALILSSAQSTRPSNDERGYTHARAPPPHPESKPPTSAPHR